MGFFAECDGRIDNPNAGWKGKDCGQRWEHAPFSTTKAARVRAENLQGPGAPRPAAAVKFGDNV